MGSKKTIVTFPPSLEAALAKIGQLNLKKIRTVEAIALGFKDNIVYDYTIPSLGVLRDFVIEVLNRKDLTIGDDLKKVISEIVQLKREEPSFLERQIQQDEQDYSHEWFCGMGTLYRIRPSAAKSMRKRVNKYWLESEISDFGRLSQALGECSTKYYSKKR